jgi:hypothetical protein
MPQYRGPEHAFSHLKEMSRARTEHRDMPGQLGKLLRQKPVARQEDHRLIQSASRWRESKRRQANARRSDAARDSRNYPAERGDEKRMG